MRIIDPDLDAIKRLLSRSAWVAIGCTEADADRWRAAVALAWYCGARGLEIARMTVAHWRPGGEDAIQMPENDAALKNVDVRRRNRRLLPLLDPVSAIVEVRMAAVGRGLNDLVFASEDAPFTSPRGSLEALGPKLKAISGGSVPTLEDLRSRLVHYVTLSGADKACQAWLSGWPGEKYLGARRAPPSLDELRAVLMAVHPLPRAERWMWREREPSE